jgi:hypothetical protein
MIVRDVTHMQYKFDELLSEALMDWPEEIDLRDALRVESQARYSVKGLGHMVETLSDRYIGREDEVIFRNMHQSIHVVLHRIAPDVTRIKIANLRSQVIQRHFEICLRDGMRIADMGYSQADIAVCKSYFEANRG